jgi:hypothetical protein
MIANSKPMLHPKKLTLKEPTKLMAETLKLQSDIIIQSRRNWTITQLNNIDPKLSSFMNTYTKH